MSLLKLVLVKISIFMIITKASIMRQYLLDCVSAGSASTLYANPAITTAFYTSMTNAAAAIQTAVTVCAANNTKANRDAIKDAIAAGKVVAASYASQVQVIANLPINAATREAAKTNIEQSHLTAQKLNQTTIGIPETPVLTGENNGIGKIKVKVTNPGVSYDPKTIIFVAVSLPIVPVTVPPTPPPADPVVTLIAGQVMVKTSVACEVITITQDGKGREVDLVGLTAGTRFSISAYTKNGNKLVSVLSNAIIVQA